MEGSLQDVLFLKGIDPVQLGEKYRAGYCSRLTIPSDRAILRNGQMGKLLIPGNNPAHDNIFVIRAGCQGTETFATTNCVAFKSYSSKGAEIKGGQCNWCRRQFTGSRWGLILKIEYGDDELEEDSRKAMTLYTEGCSCSLECAAAEARLLSFDPQFGGKYGLALDNIRHIYAILHPDKVLQMTPHYLLLTTYEGSIDPDNIAFTTFTPINEMIIKPVKTVFAVRKETK